MKYPAKIVVGSRGSELAKMQSRWVIKQIQQKYPLCQVEFRIIKTLGDLDQKTALTDFKDWGIFVKELQKSLLEGSIDLVVHSLKDVPEENPGDLVLTAFPKREQANDLLITSGYSLDNLPKNGIVGTSSPRRIMQLRKIRSDLQFTMLRGNLSTRIEKLQTKKLDAIVLAAAGINRLQLKLPFAQTLSLTEMVPAIGQGALALECRKKDVLLRNCLGFLNDETTSYCVNAERRFMKALGGGCQIPMAAHIYDTHQGKETPLYQMLFSLGLEKVKNKPTEWNFTNPLHVYFERKTGTNLDNLVEIMLQLAINIKNNH